MGEDNGNRDRERDREDSNKWGNSMPSSSRRGSYTSGHNSSQSSIESNANSQSTHCNSQSMNDSNGTDYDALFSATLYLDSTAASTTSNSISTRSVVDVFLLNSPPHSPHSPLTYNTPLLHLNYHPDPLFRLHALLLLYLPPLPLSPLISPPAFLFLISLYSYLSWISSKCIDCDRFDPLITLSLLLLLFNHLLAT